MMEYDFQRIQQLLKDFYNLTNIKIGLYDRNEHEICHFPVKYTPFCRELRKDSRQNEKCIACDRLAFLECQRTHKPYSYTCHAGLLECFAPILHNDLIIGYIVIGQIKNDRKEKMIPLSPKLQEYYEMLPTIPSRKIASAFNILEVCAGYEYLKKLDLQAKSMENDIRNYVAANLANDLSVPILCRRFRLSRVALYELFKTSFHTTVADFIQKARIEYACKLLKDTSLPIHQIAIKCGIRDYNYFSKVFRRFKKISARDYRKDSDSESI